MLRQGKMEGKYAIDVDVGDEAEDFPEMMDTGAERLRSAVTKKKGRGFSSADGSKGLDSVTQFDMLTEDSIGRAQKSVEGWVIFVTGLHEECTEEDLYDKFADFGPIKDLKMPLDHRSGYVKGYAIIEYATYQEAKSAVDNMNGQTVMEQVIKCDFAFVQGQQRSERPRHRERHVERVPADSGRGSSSREVKYYPDNH